jgi:hypothetical protein
MAMTENHFPCIRPMRNLSILKALVIVTFRVRSSSRSVQLCAFGASCMH